MSGTTKNGKFTRIAWSDRFNHPTINQLRRDLRERDGELLDSMRHALRQIDDAREELEWMGECWHWTVVYRTGRSNGMPSEPLAVIIPSPTDLQLAVPLDRAFMQSLSMNRLKRAVRDGLELAQEPFDTHWAVWSVTAGLLEDLQDLVELKLKHLAKRAG